MSRTDTDTRRRAALAHLRSGRVQILEVLKRNIVAGVQSSRPGHNRHIVDHGMATGWACTCMQPGCSHVLAVQLVTGGTA